MELRRRLPRSHRLRPGRSPESTPCEAPWLTPCAAQPFHSTPIRRQIRGHTDSHRRRRQHGERHPRSHRRAVRPAPSGPAPPARTARPAAPAAPARVSRPDLHLRLHHHHEPPATGPASPPTPPASPARSPAAADRLALPEAASSASGLVVRYSVNEQVAGHFEVLLSSARSPTPRHRRRPRRRPARGLAPAGRDRESDPRDDQGRAQQVDIVLSARRTAARAERVHKAAG